MYVGIILAHRILHISRIRVKRFLITVVSPLVVCLFDDAVSSSDYKRNMEGKRTVKCKGDRSDQLSHNSRHYTENFLSKLRRGRIQVEIRILDAQNMIQYRYFPHSFFWYTGHGTVLSKSMQYGPP
jgi:hypothetical protein